MVIPNFAYTDDFAVIYIVLVVICGMSGTALLKAHYLQKLFLE